MADGSKIEWTQASWNPIVGCSLVSPGCTHCYAMALAARLLDRPGSHYDGTTRGRAGGAVWTGKVALAPDDILTAPLRWKRPRRIFVNSMGDLFHEAVPDEWIDRVFAVIALCEALGLGHTMQILTKRSSRTRAYIASRSTPGGDGEPAEAIRIAMTVLAATPSRREIAPALKAVPLGKFCARIPWPLPNVHLGVSVEDQPRADERIPDLLATPAAVRFVSAEPLLGEIDFTSLPSVSGIGRHLDALSKAGAKFSDLPGRLDWVIVGGESGPRARPMHPDWARGIRDQCAEAGVPFFFKQWGEWTPGENVEAKGTLDTASYFAGEWSFGRQTQRESEETHVDDEPNLYRVGKRRAGRRLDGVEHNAFPEAR